MLRLENCRDEWERRKTYLIRSLFEDRPFLSPIIETEEPVSPQLPRRGSPLPDLIIEPIRKVNLYDEPEEFYIALEKEMRRLYRRDFLNTEIESESSSDNYVSNIFEENNETFEDDDISDIDVQITHEDQKSLDTTEINETNDCDNLNKSIRRTASRALSDGEKLSQTFTEQPTDNRDYSDISDEDICEEVTTQAEIHEEIDFEMDEVINTIGLQNGSSLSTVVLGNFRGRALVDAGMTGYQSNNQNEELAETEDARTKSSEFSNNTTLPEPEVMRQRITMGSFGSVPHKDSSKSEDDSIVSSRSLSMVIDSTELTNGLASAVQTGLEDATAFSESIVNTSTPKPLKKSFTFSTKVKRRKKRLVSYSTSYSYASRSSYGITTKAIQTSFSDEEIELRNLWTNFFVGDQVVYKLCLCGNHTCT